MRRILRELKSRGILAINKRNADYTLKHNPRRLYPLVDDKLRTKQLALDNGIGVPPLYGVIEVEGQVREIPEIIRDHQDFVIKPAHGSGGEGILVITGRTNGRFRRAAGTIIGTEELHHHVFNTLGGLYSLGGQPDKVIIEYRVRFDPTFEAISYLGVPDIRIIVFLGVPVMSMVRLPTRMSDGKANLHQGAVGAGIDMATGRTVSAVLENDIVEEHPDTGNPVIGVPVPNWGQLLDLAARCHDMTGLGYQGVDIVLDKDKGPLVLELNARPGLNIQIANKAGLLKRLDAVEQNRSRLESLSDRIAFARENFGSDR
ncbi:MAG: alpha-L-glutamate ligase-like protein [Pseudomonadota bacterium]